MSETVPAPLISVVMSVHNGRRYLAAAVESILAQTFRDFEFIIIDDGSTDGATEDLRAFAARDARIRLIVQENQGLTKALNTGLRAARGEFIARMDSDDIAYPERFAKQVEFLRAHPEVVCVGAQVRFIDEDGEAVGAWPRPLDNEDIQERLLQGEGALIIHPVCMMRLAALERVGFYDARFKRGQDFALWMRLAEIGKLANMGEVLLDWRHHGSTAGYTASGEQYEVVKTVLREAYQRRGLPAADLPTPPCFVRTSPADRHVSLAKMAASQGCDQAAAKHARRALPYLGFGSDAWLEMKSIASDERGWTVGALRRWQRVRRRLSRMFRLVVAS